MATNTRLTADDWLQAGYATVAEEGLNALKLNRLCARLRVTKGSFYWHFVDMAAYRQALIESWAQLKDSERRDIEQMRDVPARERLSRMMAALVRPRQWSLERAMREWARSDENAVREAFRNLGFDADEADR